MKLLVFIIINSVGIRAEDNIKCKLASVVLSEIHSMSLKTSGAREWYKSIIN